MNFVFLIQVKRVWKGLDQELRKEFTARARENKKDYYKNKQVRSREVSRRPTAQQTRGRGAQES